MTTDLNSKVKEGDRIKVTFIHIGTEEKPDDLAIKYDKKLEGELGTVTSVNMAPSNNISQIWCKFDSGRHIAILDGLDKYEIIRKGFEF